MSVEPEVIPRLLSEVCRSCPIPHTFYYDEDEPEREQCPKCSLTICRGHYGCQKRRWRAGDNVVDDLSQAWGRYSTAEQMQRPDRCCYELYREVFDLENDVRRRLGIPERQWSESRMTAPPADGLSRWQRRWNAEKETQEAKAQDQSLGHERPADDRSGTGSMGETVGAVRGGNWFTRFWRGEKQ